jgi:hypothetical protein
LTERVIEVIIYLFFLEKEKGGSDEPRACVVRN